MNPNGNWTLNVADNAAGDLGSVVGVSFDFCTVGGATINQYTFPVGSTTVTWSFDDGNGNTLTQLQLINAANDTQGPTFTCQPITVELDEDGSITIPASAILGESIAFTSGNLGFGSGAGSTNYCYTAAAAATVSFDWDYVSNNSNAFFDQFGTTLNGTYTALATGDGNVIVDIPSLLQSGSFNVNLAAGDEFCFTALTEDNGFGNSETQVSNLVVDGQLFDAADWTETTVNSDGGVDITAPSATDNCGVDFSTLTLGGAATWEANCGNIGTNSVELSLTDINGNPATCMASITVEDNLSPELTNVPANETVACGNIPASGTPTIVDNCSTGLTPILNTTTTQSGNPNTCSNYSYVITRTWSTTDNAGNVANAVQTITVEDNDAPTDPVYADNIGMNGMVSADPTGCQATVNLSLTGLTDCAPFANITVTNDATAGGADASGVYPVGTHNVNFTVTDPCGNSVSYNRVFTVVDDGSPIAICKSVTLGLPSNGSLTLLPGFIDDGSSDNCTAQGDYSVTPNQFDCSHADGVTQWPVTLSVTDENLNTATCNSFVVIQDNFDPTVMCNNITIELDQNSMASITVADIDNGSFDNCTPTSDLIYTLSKTTFNETNVGVNQVQLSVEDSNGNVGSCFATVTVTLPQVCLTVGAQAGPSGTTVTVPVTVSDFTNVGSFQFYLLASNPSVIDIVDVRALPALGFGSFVTNEIFGSNYFG